MDNIVEIAQTVINSSLTDQEVAMKCPSLTPEDIHMIRNSQTDLKLLPYVAVQELYQLGEKAKQQTVLLSPLRIKEFELFKERLATQFHHFNDYQQQKFQSEESQMDDLILADLMKTIQDHVFDDEEELLQYFIQYTEALTGNDISRSFI